MKYLYQKYGHKVFDCGIMAMLNASYYWFGDDSVLKKLKFYNKKYGIGSVDGGEGASLQEMQHLAYELGLEIIEYQSNHHYIKKLLANNLPVVLTTTFFPVCDHGDANFSHAVFVPELKSGNKIVAVNLGNREKMTIKVTDVKFVKHDFGNGVKLPFNNLWMIVPRSIRASNLCIDDEDKYLKIIGDLGCQFRGKKK